MFKERGTGRIVIHVIALQTQKKVDQKMVILSWDMLQVYGPFSAHVVITVVS